MKHLATKTFTADLITHGSWGARELGAHASTMTLYVHETENRGCIEWVIPHIDDCEDIGLWFEMRDGVRHLTDYDGIMALPREAVELLRAEGFVVDKEFE